MIEVSSLSFAYGSRQVLRQAALKVSNGKIYGIFGLQGAGKSTLLALLAGGLTPQTGTVRINGFDTVREPAAARRCIGYLPQTAAFYKSMTVYELLHFLAAARGVQDNRRFLHVHETLESADLGNQRNCPISRLSPAESCRLGLAQALIGDPEILMLDAPTEGLTTAEARFLRAWICELGEKGKTVFLASGSAGEISDTCQEVFLLEDGELSAPAPLGEWLHGAWLTLRAGGDREALQNALAESGQILSCRSLPSGEEGVLAFRLRAAQSGGTQALIQALTAAGATVHTLEELPPSAAEEALRRAAPAAPHQTGKEADR